MSDSERSMIVITGHARACTTLLTNIFIDNPKFRGSSTSTSSLCRWCAGFVEEWSQSIDVREMLLRDPTGKECNDTLRRMIRGFIEGRYPLLGEEEIIFDKSRDWMLHYDMLRSAYPDMRMIVMVRDLRSIIASCERPIRSNGLLTDGRPKTFQGRLNQYLSEDPIQLPTHGKFGTGIVGGPLLGIRDLIQRGDGTVLNLEDPDPNLDKHVMFVRAEDLQRDPELTMRAIYRFLGKDYWHPPHDYKNVGDHATDPDSLYLNFFRHEGCGEVLPPKQNAWADMMNEEVADAIIRKPELLWYHRKFRYIRDVPPDRVDSRGDDDNGSRVVLKKSRTRRGRRR